MEPVTIPCALIGLGHVGRNFLRILETKAAVLADRYGLAFRPVLVADSSGVALRPQGFDPAALRRHKEAGGRVADLPEYLPNATVPELLDASTCQLVLDASPVNLEDGEPGLGIVRRALSLGISCVLANKGPLVLAFQELHRLAQDHGAGLAFSATVCGALPVINIGQRDLVAADIQLFQGILNSTTNFILSEMTLGRSYAEALAEAQRRGIAETDPSLDVEGWDAANKLVIVANALLRYPARLEDVSVEGITGLSPEHLDALSGEGKVVKLLATARRLDDGGYELSVAPTELSLFSFLGSCAGWEMGVEFHSDLYGRMYHKIWEREPLPTAAAMLRDAVNLWRG